MPTSDENHVWFATTAAANSADVAHTQSANGSSCEVVALSIMPKSVLPFKGRSAQNTPNATTPREWKLADLWRKIEATPADAGTYEDLARELFKSSQIGEAVVFCKRAISLAKEARHDVSIIEDGIQNAFLMLGMELFVGGYFQSAINAFVFCVEFGSRNVGVYNLLGRCLDSVNRSEEAIEYYRKSLEIKSDQRDIKFDIGLLYIRTGRLSDGISALKTVTEGFLSGNSPYKAQAYFVLGMSLAATGNSQESIAAFIEADKAFNLDKDNQETSYNSEYVLKILLHVEQIKNHVYLGKMDEVGQMIAKLSMLTGVPVNSIQEFIDNFKPPAQRGPAAMVEAGHSVGPKKPRRTGGAADDSVAIARLQAALAELCKTDLTSVSSDDEAIRLAQNVARTADRLKARGVKELPPLAVEPVRLAYRMVKAYQRRKAKAPSAD